MDSSGVDLAFSGILDVTVAGTILAGCVLLAGVIGGRWVHPRFLRFLAVIAIARFGLPLVRVETAPIEFVEAWRNASPVAASPSVEPAWLFYAWLCGLLAVAVYSIGEYLGLRRLLVLGIDDDAATRRVHEIGYHGVRVRRTDASHSPFVAGVFRPVIVVPKQWWEWDEATRAAVTHHELAHVRQHDFTLRLVARAVTAVHWFNPMAWWIARRFDRWSELACDHAVLARTGMSSLAYSRVLLAVAEQVGAPPAVKTPATSFGRRHELRRRVAHLLEPRVERPLAAAALASIVAAAVLTTSVRPEPRVGHSPEATLASVIPIGGLGALAMRLPGRRVEAGHSDHEKALVVRVTVDMAGSVLRTRFVEGSCPDDMKMVDAAIRAVHWQAPEPEFAESAVHVADLSIITDYREGHPGG